MPHCSCPHKLFPLVILVSAVSTHYLDINRMKFYRCVESAKIMQNLNTILEIGEID
jgi:hypothetical protein